jgi:hypothetical protein
MFTITTLDDEASPSPIRAAPIGARPTASRMGTEIAIVIATWSGARSRIGRCSSRSRSRSISIPTSNSRSVTPTSARSSIWCRSAT